MPRVIRSKESDEDLRTIYQYIAADNPDAAERLLRKIDTKLEDYAALPEMGMRRDVLSPGVRSFPVGSYLVFYRIIDAGIEVVRVLHGKRDIKKLFE